VQEIAKLLLELGSGFAFMGNQYPIAVGTRECFIELLFSNEISDELKENLSTIEDIKKRINYKNLN